MLQSQILIARGPEYVDKHYMEIAEIKEKEMWQSALRKSDYYESEGIDCDPQAEFERMLRIEERLTDLLL